jgi:hypothetical protein
LVSGDNAAPEKFRGRVLCGPEEEFLLLHHLLHVVMVMMMMMVLHHVMMVMLHRGGFGGHRGRRDARGERNGEEDLLQHGLPWVWKLRPTSEAWRAFA